MCLYEVQYAGMEPLIGNQTWWSMALDRQRSLAITSPLQELDTSKGHIGAQKHDIRTYCLYVIDQVTSSTSRSVRPTLGVLVASPALFEVECKDPRQMTLANGFCRYLEKAQRI